ncbi:MAG TPA: NrfD/PsrC family molybdoenzyme membrane anchor subunit [Candidatus Dormibacteraeota bacterium]|jgi:formate-dependent nitrite reductase membrane component NrfD
MLAVAEHFVRPPNWEWYILAYFFLAGLAGGSYALATTLRIWGHPRDEAAARLGFYISFPSLLACPLLLTSDLGASWWKFWHMLVNVTPGQVGLNFKYWSPMSVGAWALTVFGLFSTVSFIEALVLDKRLRNPLGDLLARALRGGVGRAFNIVGAVIGVYLASYTGVLLSVSNQPLWSDTWALGGLFLASGLSASAALIGLLARRRADARFSETWVRQADGYFAGLEFVLLLVFFGTLATAGTVNRALGFPWILLWAVAAVGLVPALSALARPQVRARVGGGGALSRAAITSTGLASLIVLVGVLALRAAVMFSAQQ